MQLCVTIKGPDFDTIKDQLTRAAAAGTEIVEMRWDLYSGFAPEELFETLRDCPAHILSTVRSEVHGGNFSGTKKEYEDYLMRCAACEAAWVDIELDAPVGVLQRVRSTVPRSKVLVSHHDLRETPTNLDDLLVELCSMPGDGFKLATTATSSLDALRLLRACRKANHRSPKVCGIAMGEAGSFARVLAPLAGMPMMFAALSEQDLAAPGQLSIRELRSVYQQNRWNRDAKIFAIIGRPVTHSPGHLVHNAVFSAMNIAAVYVKIAITSEELTAFMHELQQWSWQGLSVTMPLKEAIVSLCDQLSSNAEQSRAVNTVVSENKQIVGYNSDGEGALNAIEAKLPYGIKGGQFVIAGAGGTAVAVTIAAKRRGANVVLVNRSMERAERVAERLDVEAKGLDHLPRLLHSAPTVFANCTPVGMAPDTEACLCKVEDLRSDTLVFDVVAKPTYTRLIRNAWQAGCTTATGLDMFIEQALIQYRYWFQKQLDEAAIRRVIDTIVSQML